MPFDSYSLGAEVAAVAIGDVTGDGLDDVVAATGSFSWNPNDNTSKVFIFPQASDGGLGNPVRISWNATANRIGIALGDLNSDGIQDIVIGHGSGITLLTADGAGGFHREQQTGQACDDVGILDIDLDGNLDVVGQSWSSGTQLFYGNGTGGIRAIGTLSTSASGYNDLKVADVTGDGFMDLVISSGQGQRSFVVYPHDRMGGFPIGRTYPLPAVSGGNPLGVAVGDFNHDGRNDVALTEPKNSPAHIWIYHQGPNGLLTEGPALSSYDIPEPALSADLDRDGRADLITLHGGWNALGYYLQGPDGLGTEIRVSTGYASHYESQALAAGDFNGDGCTDVAFGDYNNGLTLLVGQNCVPLRAPKAMEDVDADGRSDLMWRQDAKGYWGYWAMQAGSVVGSGAYAVGPAWDVIATGDFTGNGYQDLIWSDGATMQMWQGGASGYTGAGMQAYPAGYRIVATGDVDGDGKADLVWRDAANTTLAVWTMDGAHIAKGRAYNLSARWRIAGAGDLTGDRRLDLVVTDGNTMSLWSGAANLVFAQAAMGGWPAGWELAGVGDVGGDGRDDLFWRHADAGYFVVWTMAGPRRVAGATYRVDGNWRVLRTGDYTGDGKADVVWTNGSINQLWASKGASFAGIAMPNYPAGWSMLTR